MKWWLKDYLERLGMWSNHQQTRSIHIQRHLVVSYGKAKSVRRLRTKKDGIWRFGSNFVGQTDVKFEDSRVQDDTTSPVQRNKKTYEQMIFSPVQFWRTTQSPQLHPNMNASDHIPLDSHRSTPSILLPNK